MLNKPTDKEHKRILYIGDSISCAIRLFATRATDEKIYFDGFGTSKALDNPYFKSALSLFARQECKRDVILFNNGLHGWHLTDEEYAAYYEDMLNFLMKEFKSIPIIVVLTTQLVAPENKERADRVIKRNEYVLSIAKKTI